MIPRAEGVAVPCGSPPAEMDFGLMDPPHVLWRHPVKTATSRLGRHIQALLAALERVGADSPRSAR
jgi:hypothetical protein